MRTVFTLEDLYKSKRLVNYRKTKSLPRLPKGCVEAFEVRPDYQKPSVVYTYWSVDKAEAAFLFYANDMRSPRVRMSRIAVIVIEDMWRKVSFRQTKFTDEVKYPTPKPEEQAHA